MHPIIPATEAAVATAPFKIVILYQNLTGGIRAREMAERLGSQANSQAELNVMLWKFDVLEYPSMQELAAQDAASADMLIVAADLEKLPPVSVRDWLEHVLPVARGKDTNCALVAMLRPGEEGRITWSSQNEVRDYFQQVAVKLAMDFFCKIDSDPAETGSGRKQDLTEGNLLFLDESFTPDARWRRWGINE